MRYAKILRIFTIVFILLLLILVMPPATVQAQLAIGTLTLPLSEGAIGTEVTVSGTNFTPTTTTERYVAVFFSNQSATTSDSIDTAVTTYEKVRDAIFLDEYGKFTVKFKIPDVLNDGSTVANVTSGTYYVYVCYYQLGTTTLMKTIRAVAQFTVTAGKITLSVAKGTVGTEVQISGTNFSPNKEITFRYDGSDIAVKSGDTVTSSAGAFNSFIVIPESWAGAHSISVMVAGVEGKASFTAEPKATLSPTSAEPETTVTVRGNGFARRKELTIYFNNVGLATTTTDAQGSFTTTFKVPKLAAGTYNVEAEDPDLNRVALKFTVTAPATPTPPPPPPTPVISLTISPNKGTVGTDVGIGGSGFKEGATITVRFDDKEVATGKAGGGGIFVATFKVPSGKPGDHTITVSDGTKTEKVTFKLEVTPPPAPEPLAPAMGVTVKLPLTFDWRDVTSDNPPVTYTLQIASSRDFSPASVLLERKGLMKSEYTVTKAEQGILVGQEAPYYWRIRAVDSVGTEGNWTGAGEFRVPKPFTLPDWAKYAIAGVGGFILFLFGFWLGRRSAYAY